MTSPESPIDLLVLSPHLDDAALSCGGQIHRMARTGGRVVVLTVFAGGPSDDPCSAVTDRDASPAAVAFHALIGLEAGEAGVAAADAAVAARRAEDRVACEILGAEGVRWRRLDAVYRRHPDGPLPSLAALFDRARPVDEALVAALAADLRALPPLRRLLVPLGVGGHLDHRTVRAAAERAFPPSSLRYYEDLPYARSRRARWHALGLSFLGELIERPLGPWRSEPAPWAEIDLEAKIAAVAAYASQVEPLFGSAERMAHTLDTVAERLAIRFDEPLAEAVWRATGSLDRLDEDSFDRIDATSPRGASHR
ncbi:MAG: PIG-L family deacetylase [Acidobacteriota bacterium]